MFSIEKTAVPPNSLLETYLKPGFYVDCYSTEFPAMVRLGEFIYAFYTTSLFQLERMILAVSVAKPSTNDQARQLAHGMTDSFAAWNVEQRNETELLMCDFMGRTRSWLMVMPVDASRTRLYFGSVVVPVRNARTGQVSLGIGYQALLTFHRIYSVLLLYFAKRNVPR